jgi:hypothetical protein
MLYHLSTFVNKKVGMRSPTTARSARRFSIALSVSLVLGALASLGPTWLASPLRPQAFPCRFWLCSDKVLVDSADQQIWYGGKGGLAGGTELLRRAVAQDPASAYRWCDLGEALLESGQQEQARQCFLRAADLGPNSPAVLTRVSSFYFRIGDSSRALQSMSRILALTPDYDQLIFGFYARMEAPIEQILVRGVPRQRRPAQSYFRYLLRTGTPAAVTMAWNWTAARLLTDDLLACDYVEFLLKNHQYQMAAEAWSSHLGSRAAGYLQTNYLFNGSFEFDLTGAPFDWRVEPAEGVGLKRDRDLSREGGWSLQIRFDGSQNVGYHHVRQRAFLRRGRYRLEAYARSAGLTTDQGVGLRAIDADSPARLDVRTGTVVGTTDWTRLESILEVKQPSALVEVQVVRRPSMKFDNCIGGSVWIDDVKLLPLDRRFSSARP